MNFKGQGPLSQEEGRAKGCVWHGPEASELRTAGAQGDEKYMGRVQNGHCQRFAGHTLCPALKTEKADRSSSRGAYILVREVET